MFSFLLLFTFVRDYLLPILLLMCCIQYIVIGRKK